MNAKLGAAIVAIAAVAAPAGAVTYNAYDSFTGMQGAGGFVYGFSNGTNSSGAFETTATGSACPYNAGSGTCLFSGLSPNGNLPAVQKGGTYSTVTDPGARLYLHPGDNANYGVAAVFVASTAGTYSYSIGLQSIGTDTTNGVGYRLISFVGPTITPGPRSVLANYLDTGSLTGSINLAAGAGVGVVVDYNGNFGGDSTALDFNVTSGAVPEPATWAMMLVGFGLAGTAARRRRTLATA